MTQFTGSPRIALQPSADFGDDIMPLLTYLKKKFDQEEAQTAKDTGKPAKVTKTANAQLTKFLAFGQDHLNKFPPVQAQYLAKGVGVRLANGVNLSIAEDVESEAMHDEGIHITRPRSLRGQGGMQASGGISTTTPRA